MHKTSAWPLSQAYVALIIYASLYPFSGWHDQGINPLEFLWSPLPRYWTWFDLTANALGYGPLGFLLALSFLRRGRIGPMPATRSRAIIVATLAAAVLVRRGRQWRPGAAGAVAVRAAVSTRRPAGSGPGL